MKLEPSLPLKLLAAGRAPEHPDSKRNLLICVQVKTSECEDGGSIARMRQTVE